MGRLDMLRLWSRHHARRWTVVLAVGALALTTLLGSGALLYAHPAFPPGQEGAGDVTLRGHTIPALAHAKALRPTDGATALDLAVALTPRDPQALDALIAAQNDSKSPQYHQYLTPDQFAARFGPAQATVEVVKSFLAGHGLVVSDVSPNRLIVHATGSVSSVERAFGVQINDYQLGSVVAHAPANDPVVPSELGTTITGITGMDNVSVEHAHAVGPNHNSTTILPHAGPGGGYTPANIRAAYDMNPLLTGGFDGTGQSVALFELAGFDANDVTAYRNNYALGALSYQTINVDGGAPVGNGTSEVELDMEVLSAVAPGAKQLVYVAPNGTGIVDAYNRIATDNLAKVVSTSWGICEQDMGQASAQSLDNIFKQNAAQGQAIFAAAGDAESYDCYHDTDQYGNPSPNAQKNILAVDNPADDPNVLGVGGTKLTLALTGGYGSETTWDWYHEYTACFGYSPCVEGGGGGVSQFFGRPTYQSGTGLSTNMRTVPDVAADADPDTGYSVYCTHDGLTGWNALGGTSAAAPLWAGAAALLNHYLPSQGVAGLNIGNAIGSLYYYAQHPQPYAPFHDVTTGNNIGYTATAGYDEVTGWGTPDVWNLARDMTAPSIATSPTVVGVAATTAGASPAPQTLTIQNSGNGPLNWTQTATLPSWLTLSASSGTIPNHSSQQITLTFNVPNSTSRQALTTALTFSDPNAVPGSVNVPVTVASQTVSKDWYFAEGFTGRGFDTKLALANPNPTPAHVTITYHLSAAPTTVQHVGITMAPYARFTDDVNNFLAGTAGTSSNNGGAGYGVAAEVHADAAVVAERVMYFNGDTVGFDVMGATHLGHNFAFDYLDSTSGHMTLFTVLNPSSTATMYAHVALYAAATGQAYSGTITVAPNARGAGDISNYAPPGLYSGVVTLSSDQAGTTPLDGLVERPAYWTNPTSGFYIGEDVIGASATQAEWDFAEGWTNPGGAGQGLFHETLYLANPAPAGSPTANATVTIYREDGGAPVPVSVNLPAGQQQAVDVNAALPASNSRGNSIKVTSTGAPVLAERLMTWDYGATDLMGSPGTANAAYFAESYTGGAFGGFTEILTLENPNSTPAYLTVTYFPANDANPSAVPPPVTMTWTIPANARSGFSVNPYMPNQGFSVQIVSSQPILAERVMYFNGGRAGTDAAGYQGEP